MKPKRGPLLLSEVKDLRTTVGWRVRGREGSVKSRTGRIFSYSIMQGGTETVTVIWDGDTSVWKKSQFCRFEHFDEAIYLQVVPGKKK